MRLCHRRTPLRSILKYCILGDAGVGKTSLLFRLTQPGEPLRAPEPTIGVDFGSKVIEVGGGRRVKVQCEPLLETKHNFRLICGGQAGTRLGLRLSGECGYVFSMHLMLTVMSDRRSITRSYFRGSAGSLLVFDVTERSSGSTGAAEHGGGSHRYKAQLLTTCRHG